MTDDIVTRLREAAQVDEYYALTMHRPMLIAIANEIERLRTLLDNALDREHKDNERQLQIVRKVEADRDKWLKIAMFNLTAIYGDQTQHHIDTCYEVDGTYHGGAK